MVVKRVVVLILAVATALVACAGNGGEGSGGSADPASLEEQAWAMVDAGALLLDVRTPQEYDAGHLEGAVNIPYDQVKARIGELGADKDRAIVIHCRSGRRSAIAENTLRSEGFTNILDAKRYDRMQAAWEARNK